MAAIPASESGISRRIPGRMHPAMCRNISRGVSIVEVVFLAMGTTFVVGLLFVDWS